MHELFKKGRGGFLGGTIHHATESVLSLDTFNLNSSTKKECQVRKYEVAKSLGQAIKIEWL